MVVKESLSVQIRNSSCVTKPSSQGSWFISISLTTFSTSSSDTLEPSGKFEIYNWSAVLNIIKIMFTEIFVHNILKEKKFSEHENVNLQF